MNGQFELNLNPDKPREIITHNSDEFFDLCDRADRLALVNGKWEVVRRGEFAVETISVVPQQNACYKVRVRWH